MGDTRSDPGRRAWLKGAFGALGAGAFVARVRTGYLELPRGPGLGIELDEDALADKIGHDWTNPEEYDADDASVMDW